MKSTMSRREALKLGANAAVTATMTPLFSANPIEAKSRSASAPDPPAEGDIIDLCFKVPGGYVRGPGIVRHSHKGKGMGIQFTFINQEARARLAHLLDKLLTSSSKT